MSVKLLELVNDAFDFTPYIARQGYDISEDVPVEKSSTVQSSGYRKRTLATYGLTTIKVKFPGGMNPEDIKTCRSYFNVANKAEFKYWSPLHNDLCRSYFYVTVDPISIYSVKDDDGIKYGDWGVTLEQCGETSYANTITVTKYPTAAKDLGSKWTNINDIHTVFLGDDTNDNHYATNIGVTDRDQGLRLFGFGFTAEEIPDNAKINRITIEMAYHVNSTSSTVLVSLQAAYKGTGRGTKKTSTAEPMIDDILSTTSCGTWKVSELRDNANAQIQIGYNRTSSTECKIFVKYVRMSVDYRVA